MSVNMPHNCVIAAIKQYIQNKGLMNLSFLSDWQNCRTLLCLWVCVKYINSCQKLKRGRFTNSFAQAFHIPIHKARNIQFNRGIWTRQVMTGFHTAIIILT